MYLNNVKLKGGTKVRCIGLKSKDYWMYYDIGDVCTVKDNGNLINPRTGHDNLGGIYAWWEIHEIKPLQYEEMM